MNLRSVKYLLYANQVDMGGMLVRQPFPTQKVDQIDPFLLLHHVSLKFREGSNPLSVGVGPHPHRGFSPVTFVYKGGVHHRDSRGNSSVIYEGGTQWMHAGKGIIHSERPAKEIAENGGEMEIIQLWINVPQSSKMAQPNYHPLTEVQTPTWYSKDGKVVVKVVSGSFDNINGPVKTFSPLNVWRVSMQKDSQINMSTPEDHNTCMYIPFGQINLKGYGLVEHKNLAYFNQDGNDVIIKATENAELLMLSGQPINEPVKQYGPYVMNSQTELMQAMRDYQMGKMGILIEE